jgi:hypothetical protein
MPTLFRVLHGPSYRHLRNRVKWHAELRSCRSSLEATDGRSEFGLEVEVNTERAAALADYTGKSRCIRGFGLLTDSRAEDWAPSFFAKSLYLFVRDREIASCDTRNLVTARPARFLEHVVKRFPTRPVAPGPLTRSP